MARALYRGRVPEQWALGQKGLVMGDVRFWMGVVEGRASFLRERFQEVSICTMVYNLYGILGGAGLLLKGALPRHRGEYLYNGIQK